MERLHEIKKEAYAENLSCLSHWEPRKLPRPPPSCGQDDLTLLMITLISSQKSPTPNISAPSVYLSLQVQAIYCFLCPVYKESRWSDVEMKFWNKNHNWNMNSEVPDIILHTLRMEKKMHSVKYMQYCTWMITKHCTCILQIYDKFQPILKYGINDLLMYN